MELQWRCEKCDALLGVARGARLHLRYEEAQYVVDGENYSVLAVCRNCSTVNERTRDEESALCAHGRIAAHPGKPRGA